MCVVLVYSRFGYFVRFREFLLLSLNQPVLMSRSAPNPDPYVEIILHQLLRQGKAWPFRRVSIGSCSMPHQGRKRPCARGTSPVDGRKCSVISGTVWAGDEAYKQAEQILLSELGLRLKDTRGLSLSVKKSNSWYRFIGDLASGGT